MAIPNVAEYAVEDGRRVDPAALRSPRMSDEAYREAHKGLVISCNDVMIEYLGGLLLGERADLPAKGEMWPVGGRMYRGLSFEESLRKTAMREVGLDLDEITFLDVTRPLWATDPFGHGYGTDNVSIRFFARGKGELKLDPTWTGRHMIVKPADYTPELRETLHPYVQSFIDLAMPHVRKVT